MSYETFTISVRAKTLAALERGYRELAKSLEDEFEDDDVIHEVRELENEVRARLQHIATGDLQG